jgi:hypothetical protein
MERRIAVTPELARCWLARAVGDGMRQNPGAIIRYAEAMASGRWTNWERARLHFDGTRILDGHHRLHAVVKSGATVVFDVHATNWSVLALELAGSG